MQRIADGISILFHPLFLVMYMLLLLMAINPFLFYMPTPTSKGLLIFSIFFLSTFFPLISIIMMKMLGLISSFRMEDSKERVGPLITTGIFYIWMYLNIRTNDAIPGAFSFFVLGATISLFMGFFMNLFTKVSLHTIGVGGLLMGFIFVMNNFTYSNFSLDLGMMGKYMVHVRLVLIVLIVIAGLVGTARLAAKAHTPDQVYGGYAIGAFAQVLAFMIHF